MKIINRSKIRVALTLGLTVCQLTAMEQSNKDNPVTQEELTQVQTFLEKCTLKSVASDNPLMISYSTNRKIELNNTDIPKELKFLPSEIGNLTQLRSLSLCGLDLSLPKEIGELKNLNELTIDFSCQRNTSGLIQIIGELINLTHLTIRNCDLESQMIAPIGKMSQLKKLDLSCNSLVTIPTTFANLSHLIKLKLNKNPLNSFPRELCVLKELNFLHLEDTDILSIPFEAVNLNLKSIFLKYNERLNLQLQSDFWTKKAKIEKLGGGYPDCNDDTAYGDMEIVNQYLGFQRNLFTKYLNFNDHLGSQHQLPKDCINTIFGYCWMLEELSLFNDKTPIRSFIPLSKLKVRITEWDPDDTW